MRRWTVLLLMFVGFFAGCTTIQVPGYLQNKRASTKQFYADFARTSQAVRLAFSDLGWEIEEEASPEVYEISSQRGVKEELLMITKIRQTSFFVGTRYARINVYVRSNGEVSEVEMRYMVTSTFLIWKPSTYGNENLAKRFFELVDRHF